MKKLQKGFTLIELIVVMAIMGIIMAVIMSIISPTSRITSRVESMKDEETAAIAVGRAIKSELEFATKVYVEGVDDGESMPSVPSDLKYVYVINNSEARPNSRKGAKGVITLGTWDGSTIANETIVMQEPFWGEEEFQIGIEEFNTTPGNYYIQIGFRGYRMIVDNGAYVMDPESTYRYGEAINFVNINNKEEIQKGGNGGAANFTCEIKGDTLIPAAGKAYKDKIYIFFNPANETALSVGGGAMFTTAGAGGTTAVGGGTTAGGGGTTASTTDGPSKGNVTFLFSNNTSKTIQLNSKGFLKESMPEDIKTSDLDSTNDYVFEWVGWFQSSSPSDLSNPYKQSSYFDGNVTLHPVYRKINQYKVTFLDFNGNEIDVQYVLEGSKATAPENTPAPTDSSKVFDKWVTDSGDTLSNAITAATTFKPTDTAAKGLLYIHFLENYTKGRLVVNGSSEFFVDGNKYTTWDAQINNLNKSAGDVITVKNNSGQISVDLYDVDNLNKSLQSISINSESGERHVYYALNKNGLFGIYDKQPDMYETEVTFHVRNAPANNTVHIKNTDEAAYAKVQRINNDGSLGLTSLGKSGFDLPIGDGQKIKANTNLKITANNSSAIYELYIQGVSSRDLYLYTDLDGSYKISDQPWVENSRLIVNFLEETDGSKIKLTKGDYYFNGKINTGNNGWNSFFSETYGKTKSLDFKYLQNSMIDINGMQYTLINDGRKEEVTYYNGIYYTDASKAAEQYKIDHAGQSAFDGKITVHFSRSKLKSYDNSGEVDKFFRINGAPGWNETPGDETVTVSEGQTLTIQIVSGWNQVKNTKQFSYNDLKNKLVSEIWIMNGEIYDAKPDGWAP